MAGPSPRRTTWIIPPGSPMSCSSRGAPVAVTCCRSPPARPRFHNVTLGSIYVSQPVLRALTAREARDRPTQRVHMSADRSQSGVERVEDDPCRSGGTPVLGRARNAIEITVTDIDAAFDTDRVRITPRRGRGLANHF